MKQPSKTLHKLYVESIHAIKAAKEKFHLPISCHAVNRAFHGKFFTGKRFRMGTPGAFGKRKPFPFDPNPCRAQQLRRARLCNQA